jgi:hypothetical protein
MLDEIAEWLFVIEKYFRPFNRFVDFSRLTRVAVRTGHVYDNWISFGVACFYESLMEETPIKARAFRDLAGAAEWLSVPVDVLTLKDEPAPHVGTTVPKH